MTIQEVILKHDIRLLDRDITDIDANPHMADPQWDAHHYRLRLTCGDRSMVIYYSMGLAHTAKPILADVLDSLASDASPIIDVESFEDWAQDMGYSSDSRKAERTYHTIQEQTSELRILLRSEGFKDLLAAERL